MSADCLFCKIAKGEITAKKIYEDEQLFAFWDISPQAPKHFLIIPKKHISGPDGVAAADERLIGALIRKGSELAAAEGIPSFRLVMNNGAQAGQTVFHLHLHVLGGRAMNWPPG